MDSGHSNEARWPNNTLLTYTLPRTVKVRKSVDVVQMKQQHIERTHMRTGIMIPKLNFSTSHDTWLGEYHRMVSSSVYYRVCEDLVREVCEIFDKPRFFHLGYDEEEHENQSMYGYEVIRRGDVWWNDLLFFVKTVEKLGSRAWIWSDYYWKHPGEFLDRMPRSVLQSNWFYWDKFDAGVRRCRWDNFVELEKAGFEQLPCGSSYRSDTSFDLLVSTCEAKLNKEKVLGYMMAPWSLTINVPKLREKHRKAIDQIGTAIAKYSRISRGPVPIPKE